LLVSTPFVYRGSNFTVELETTVVCDRGRGFAGDKFDQ
jgi:hypothetical protein